MCNVDMLDLDDTLDRLCVKFRTRCHYDNSKKYDVRDIVGFRMLDGVQEYKITWEDSVECEEALVCSLVGHQIPLGNYAQELHRDQPGLLRVVWKATWEPPDNLLAETPRLIHDYWVSVHGRTSSSSSTSRRSSFDCVEVADDGDEGGRVGK
ncbi:hypothetical protein LTS10_013241 [Elasticomyces elasticus]|nr:hypothetical protein LTS10_013241 [Elasticomyces elasticus]